jgi:hypothetical protein
MLFDPGLSTLSDLADYVDEHRRRPCPEATAWLRAHDWTNVDEAPHEYAYHLLVDFLPVLGPIFRAGAIERLGSEPFWAALTWVSVKDLTEEEYAFLFARWFWRYRDSYGKRVEEGSIGPGSRAMVALARDREGSPQMG